MFIIKDSPAVFGRSEFTALRTFTQGHSLALDENIYEIRREKLKKIEALGHPAYPRKYNFSHTVPQILAEYGGQTPLN
jgi:hypothetical protein